MSELRPTNEYQSQQELLEKLLQPHPTVIAIEGGPCGGKSTLLAEIERQAETVDRSVVIIPEVATPKISEWEEKTCKRIPELAAHDRPEYLQFQQSILEGIIAEIEAKKSQHEDTDTIIVIDRCDIGAYVTPEEYKDLLRNIGKNAAPLHEYIDQVYYLPSVAREKPGKYQALKNTNPGRYEDMEDARLTCQRNQQSVASHPELHMVWGGDFAENVQQMAKSILSPELESELKQSVFQEEAQAIIAESEILCIHSISQSYHILHNQEFRLREQTDGETQHFFLTVKQGTGTVRTEKQRRITAEEHNLLRQAPQLGRGLHKSRFTFLPLACDEYGRRRLWSADKYHHPGIAEWHFETDVKNEAEADELSMLYRGVRERLTVSARDFIFVEQK